MNRFAKLSKTDKLAVIAGLKASNDLAKIVPSTVDIDKMSQSQMALYGEKFMDYVSSASTAEKNTMIEDMVNKVLISQMYKRMKFVDPITKMFFKTDGTSISAVKEIFDNQLLDSNKYNRDDRMTAAQTRAKTLTTVLKTVLKEYFTNTIPLNGYQAAFAHGNGAGEWIANQTKLLSESMEIRLFDIFTKRIDADVLNEITIVGTPSWEVIFLQLVKIARNMELPSVKYNLGFKNPSDDANKALVRKGVSKISNLVLLGHSDIRTHFDNVGTVKFHNSLFKRTQFKDFISVDLPISQILMVDKSGFEGYFRINQVASNTWGANLTMELFLHYWIVFGSIPWALGVKVKYTEPTDTHAPQKTAPAA